LAPNTTYTATMTTGAKDLAGNALASNFVWSFTTGATPDTTAPTRTDDDTAEPHTGGDISRHLPPDNSERMDPLAITPATFALMHVSLSVSGALPYPHSFPTRRSSDLLAPNTTYTATMTTGARDLAGNALAANFVWSFTTGATPDTTAPT